MTEQKPGPVGPAASSRPDGPLVAEQYTTIVTAGLPDTLSDGGLEGLIVATVQLLTTEQVRDLQAHLAALQARLAARQQMSHLLHLVAQERSGHQGNDAYGALVDKAQQALMQQLNSMSELGAADSLRLQEAMDRLSKMMTALCNILKKTQDTAATISQNLK